MKLKNIIPVVLGAGAAISGGAYLAILDYFFKLGFNARYNEVKDLDGFAQDTPYHEQVVEGVKWIREFPSETVTVTDAAGYRLVGHYFACPTAKRTILCFHGWRGKWFYDYNHMGKWFYEHDCNLLITEEQGQGASEGPYMGFGITEHLDVPVWAEWLVKEKHDGLPIYIMGRSMGAATVMMAAGKPLPDQVAGIISDCGFSSPRKMLTYFCVHQAHLPEHPFIDGVVLMVKKRTGMDVNSYSALEAMSTATKPILFIHGEADDFVPCSMTHEDFKACASPKRLLIVKGADHCMSDLVDPESYHKAVSDFFEEFK